MLTLTLLRHAKSAWNDADLDDHDRPLSPRGLRDAPRIGRWLADWTARQNRPIDYVLCSDAMRTLATLALVLPELARASPDPRGQSGSPRQEIDGALYLAAPAVIRDRIGRVPIGPRHILVVGHNPGLHMFALSLIGSGNSQLIAALSQKFPTAAAAVLECDVEQFSELRPDTARLVEFMTPKKL